MVARTPEHGDGFHPERIRAELLWFEFWRPILDLGKDKLTTDMARRTFCTLGSKLHQNQT